MKQIIARVLGVLLMLIFYIFIFWIVPFFIKYNDPYLLLVGAYHLIAIAAAFMIILIIWICVNW